MADPEHVEVVKRGAAAIAAHVYRREVARPLRERVAFVTRREVQRQRVPDAPPEPADGRQKQSPGIVLTPGHRGHVWRRARRPLKSLVHHPSGICQDAAKQGDDAQVSRPYFGGTGTLGAAGASLKRLDSWLLASSIHDRCSVRSLSDSSLAWNVFSWFSSTAIRTGPFTPPGFTAIAWSSVQVTARVASCTVGWPIGQKTSRISARNGSVIGCVLPIEQNHIWSL